MDLTGFYILHISLPAEFFFNLALMTKGKPNEIDCHEA